MNIVKRLEKNACLWYNINAIRTPVLLRPGALRSEGRLQYKSTEE